MNPLKKLDPQFLDPPCSSNHQTQSQAFFCSMRPCSTILERSIHLNTSYCLETRKMFVFGPNSCMFGPITPKLNLSLSFEVWNLAVQFQRDTYT